MSGVNTDILDVNSSDHAGNLELEVSAILALWHDLLIRYLPSSACILSHNISDGSTA